MRVRNVVRRSGVGYRGYFPSNKLKRVVQFESIFERDAIMLFEFSPGIVSYQEQPEEIHFEQDGKVHRYYPDFELRLKNDSVIHVEVKPLTKFLTVKLQTRFKAILTRYESHTATLKILTETELRQQPLMMNLNKLYRVLHAPDDVSATHLSIITYLSNRPNPKLHSLISAFGIKDVLILIVRGHLWCDLNIDLYANDNLARIPEETDHATIFF